MKSDSKNLHERLRGSMRQMLTTRCIIVIVLTASLIASLCVLALFVQRDRRVRTPVARDQLSALHIGTLDLGVVPSGKRVSVVAWIENDTDQGVTVRAITTSCSCLSAHMTHKKVAAHGKSPVLLVFDASTEPGFVGSLAIELFALCDTSRMPLGVVSVEVTDNDHVTQLFELSRY